MDEDEIQYVGRGPDLATAEKYAAEWANASAEDTEAFAILSPLIEGIKASTEYGRRFSDGVLFNWLGQVGPFTLVDALNRLGAIDMRLRLDLNGLRAYVQGYLDGGINAVGQD